MPPPCANGVELDSKRAGFTEERKTLMADVPKTFWRAMSALNNALYRASGGRLMGKVKGVPVLLLTAPGRKTGAEHTTPVLYIEDNDRFVVTGSAGGAAAEPQWFRNLRNADRAVIEVGRRRIPVSVAVATPDEREVLWQRLLKVAPFFANYQTKTDREIPMAILTPTS
jgi:deazaflavin-dependent oxidoreductase (nitroreductase family)